MADLSAEVKTSRTSRASKRSRRDLLHSRLVNLSLQPVNAAAGDFQLLVIMRGQRGVAFCLQGLNARFDRGLIDADNVMVLVNIDT